MIPPNPLFKGGTGDPIPLLTSGGTGDPIPLLTRREQEFKVPLFKGDLGGSDLGCNHGFSA
jgi:hypothetical protein